MRWNILAELIIGILLQACLWVEQSVVTTVVDTAETEYTSSVKEMNTDPNKMGILRVTSRMDSVGQTDEFPVLMLNLSLDNELAKK